MIIAQQKKKENIAEYILYMWQIEDLIRAYNLDINEIDKNIVQAYNQPEQVRKQIRNWYEGLIDLLKEENKTASGHLQFVQNTINDLNDLHLQLLKSPDHLDYIDLYNKAKEGISELANRSKGSVENEVEACFNGLYGILMLRLQQKVISPETIEAMSALTRLVALLSLKYKMLEEGKMEL
ncbi:MAG TPA: DUF4924 family protein [Bacteroidales bacterium]|nr:DUF4924 family protein [Bacteroidales bacterium]